MGVAFKILSRSQFRFAESGTCEPGFVRPKREGKVPGLIGGSSGDKDKQPQSAAWFVSHHSDKERRGVGCLRDEIRVLRNGRRSPEGIRRRNETIFLREVPARRRCARKREFQPILGSKGRQLRCPPILDNACCS